jgi:hypothetical protein
MIQRLESVVITILWLGVHGIPASAQAPVGSILHVEIVNSTLYRRGYCSIAEQGKDPTKLPTSILTPFATGVGIGDIVSVNGQPVKGVALQYFQGGSLSATFTPGAKIADITSAPSGGSWDLTFLNPDSTLVGSIHIDGNAGGPPPPGSPKEIAGGSLMVTGGTGPFFGARGYWQPAQDSVSGERQTRTAKIRPTAASMPIQAATSGTVFSTWCHSRHRRS